ncbi:hypothetical protein ABZY16_00615 [Streptomyces sp. NPDC006553]|uniref:hypothetical protein n=1 Tax=unclassified Streptomyces TaxID=2593676 RepID=UPI002256FC5F|nr:hypothetical protein [Streptomyces sp. NBC_00233]MCX5227284.1 hypothetical protein [Streptomyces sp. NBC_00233]
MSSAGEVGGTERPGLGRPSPAGRPASDAEPSGEGASLGAALGAAGDAAPVPVGAGAGDAGVPAPPVRPGEAETEEEGEGETVAEGVPEGDGATDVEEGEGGSDVGADGVVGAVAPTELPGASAPYANGSPYRTHAQANTQVRAGPRTRARALRSAGVTG